MKWGIGNVKGKSGEIIANNGAYFVDLTNATESSGVYTIPSADIENGTFTLQVGDTLIDKDSGSMLKVATLTPSITASLVFEASSGGGKQLYQHNINATDISSGNPIEASFTIITDNATALTFSAIASYLYNNGFTTRTQHISASGIHNNTNQSARYLVYGVFSTNGTGISTSEVKVASAGNSNDYAFASGTTTIIDTVIAL